MNKLIYPPETVARQGIDALKQGANYKIVGVDNYIQSLLPRLLPRKTTINVVGGMMSERMKTRGDQPLATLPS